MTKELLEKLLNSKNLQAFTIENKDFKKITAGKDGTSIVIIIDNKETVIVNLEDLISLIGKLKYQYADEDVQNLLVRE